MQKKCADARKKDMSGRYYSTYEFMPKEYQREPCSDAYIKRTAMVIRELALSLYK